MTIAMRHVVKFPANVQATKGVDVTRANGTYTFKLNYENLTPAATVASNVNVAFQDPATGAMGVTTLASALNSNANIQAIANTETGIDKLGYWNGTSVYALTDFPAYARGLISSDSASAARVALGTVIGTDVQAHSASLDGFAGKTVPTGNVVGSSDTQTLTNKTIDGDSNTLTNVPSSAVTGLSTVATSGAYGDLSGLPTLGDLAAKDQAAIADIAATGAPSSTTALFGDGTWKTPAGGGDMLGANNGDDFASIPVTRGNLGIDCLSRAVLETIDPAKIASVFLRESGREGMFQWDGSDLSAMVTLDTEQGVYVPPSSDTTGASGCWVRNYAPYRIPNVRAFGAKLDGTTDDSAAITAALAVVGAAIIPWTSTGFAAGGIDLDPAKGQIIRGEIRTVWKLKAASTYAIRVLPGSVAQNYAYIENLIFDGAAAASTAGAILINTSAGIVSGLRVKRLIFRDCGFAYKEEVHASNFVVDISLEDCECFYTRGRQVFSNRSRGFFRWREFRINNGYNVAGGRPTVTWNSAYFGDMLGLEFYCFDVVGDVPGTLSYQAMAVGLIIDGVVGGRGSIYGNRILVDSTCGPGIQISNVSNVEIDEIQSYLNLGPGLALSSVSKSSFGKIKVVGSKGVTNAVASAHGVSLTSCSLVTLDQLESDSNTGTGNIMVGSSDCQVNGGYSINNTGYGYYDDSTGDRNRRVGVTATGNTAGSLFQDKATHATFNWTPDSGTPTASTVGVASV